MSDVSISRVVSNILIVEDDPAMEAEAMSAVSVFPDARVRTARTVAEAERWMVRVEFDLAIIDLGLPDGSGITLIRRLMGDAPHATDVHQMRTVCVARTVFDDDAHLFAALSAGAQGYLLKGEPLGVFRARLLTAMAGEPVVSPAIARRVLAHFRGDAAAVRQSPPTPAPLAPAALTSRETEVLRLLAQGHTLAEVGAALALSVNTIKTHVKSVYGRLDVRSRLAAVDTARRMGILDDDTRR
jgi:DNA-binding NarL/FixJ family response regulator